MFFETGQSLILPAPGEKLELEVYNGLPAAVKSLEAIEYCFETGSFEELD